ncbi:MAG TPA: Ni/Fe-hydrogenase cytochrome b subunit [Anaeromyxobacter sp.]|nr:Ni/Fe-hydrogenase cytochrome b subunit [Anaeromyxobacter sp.]
MNHVIERPLGGPILTRSTLAVLVLAGLGLGFVAVRLFTGLGPVTAMSDAYAWGIWKPLNVVTFTGIGAGALALSLVTYVANRGRYHALVRSAVLVGAIAYTLAGFSVVVDLGRWWNVWALFVPPWWNLDSVLLEVALCVMAYCAVLWIEVFPAVLERWAERDGALSRIAVLLRPWVRRGFPFVVAVAIVLPFMHQSSLGSLFLVTQTKLHPLWHTAWLPALFLLSCLSMGAGAVIVIDTITHLAWRRDRDVSLDSMLALVMAGFSFAFLALRLGDVLAAGELPWVHGPKGLLFLVESGLFLYPAVRVLAPSYRRNPGYLFWAAQLTVAAGALYRFDTYLAAFDPGRNFAYFPSLGEILFSSGLAAIGVAIYVVAVKRLPVLAGVPEARPLPPHRRARAA